MIQSSGAGITVGKISGAEGEARESRISDAGTSVRKDGIWAGVGIGKILILESELEGFLIFATHIYK